MLNTHYIAHVNPNIIPVLGNHTVRAYREYGFKVPRIADLIVKLVVSFALHPLCTSREGSQETVWLKMNGSQRQVGFYNEEICLYGESNSRWPVTLPADVRVRNILC
jgi:hypothetical protein